MEARDWPALKKARRERRTIVFRDESGLSRRPRRRRTWAPRGHTPVLQYNFNWKKLSAVAGITMWRFYFELYPGAVRGAGLVDFLAKLRRRLPQRLLLIRDGLEVHRCRLVRNYPASLHGEIAIAQLPPCAPEPNPVEYIWGYWKQHELPNLCPSDYAQPSAIGHHTLARMRRRPKRRSRDCWRASIQVSQCWLSCCWSISRNWRARLRQVSSSGVATRSLSRQASSSARGERTMPSRRALNKRGLGGRACGGGAGPQRLPRWG